MMQEKHDRLALLVRTYYLTKTKSLNHNIRDRSPKDNDETIVTVNGVSNE